MTPANTSLIKEMLYKKGFVVIGQKPSFKNESVLLFNKEINVYYDLYKHCIKIIEKDETPLDYHMKNLYITRANELFYCEKIV